MFILLWVKNVSLLNQHGTNEQIESNEMEAFTNHENISRVDGFCSDSESLFEYRGL